MLWNKIWRRWANYCGAAGALMGISLPATAQEIQRPAKSSRVVVADDEIPVSRVGQAGEVTTNFPSRPIAISPQGERTVNTADLQTVAQLSRNLERDHSDTSAGGRVNVELTRSLAAKPTLASDSTLRASQVAGLGQTHVAAPTLARTPSSSAIDSGRSSADSGRGVVDSPIPPRSIKP